MILLLESLTTVLRFPSKRDLYKETYTIEQRDLHRIFGVALHCLAVAVHNRHQHLDLHVADFKLLLVLRLALEPLPVCERVCVCECTHTQSLSHTHSLSRSRSLFLPLSHTQMLVGGLALLMGSLELLDHLPVGYVAGLLLNGVLKLLFGVFERLLGLGIVFFEKELKVQRVALST